MRFHTVLAITVSPVLLAGAALFATRGPTSPSVKVVTDARIQCAQCRITADSLATLGDKNGPGAVTDQNRIWADAAGQYYLAGPQINGVRVFDRRGKFVTSFGRPGQGPGEYTTPFIVHATPNDSINVLDISSRRWTIVNRKYAVRGISMLPLRPSAAVFFNSDALVMTGENTRGATVGYPLHLVSRSRGLVRSFGVQVPVLDPRRPYDATRVIGKGGSASVWSSRINSYEFEEWDTAGVMRTRIVRKASWFKPWTHLNGIPREVKPEPVIRAVQGSADGMVWVMIAVADTNWRTYPPTREEAGMTYTGDDIKQKVYDTIIEVIDPRTGQLVASQRFPQYFQRFAGPGIVYSYNEDAEGYPSYTMRKLTLVRP